MVLRPLYLRTADIINRCVCAVGYREGLAGMGRGQNIFKT